MDQNKLTARDLAVNMIGRKMEVTHLTPEGFTVKIEGTLQYFQIETDHASTLQSTVPSIVFPTTVTVRISGITLDLLPHAPIKLSQDPEPTDGEDQGEDHPDTDTPDQ